MSQLGIGAILHALGGGSEKNASDYYGRVIVGAAITDEELTLTFEDGVSIKIYDGGQSCCESRYMTTDDDISSLVGNSLARIEAKDGPDEEDEHDSYGVHETCFVEVGTSGGFITLTNHNEHNGYYGGFGLCISEV